MVKNTKIATIEEFDRLTHEIIWPVLQKFGFVEGPVISGRGLAYLRRYTKTGMIVRVLYERGDDYTDIRITSPEDATVGMNIVNVVKGMGRPMDAYETTKCASLERRYEGLATLMQEQVADVLRGDVKIGQLVQRG
jgi:hypothetical protein